MLFKKNNIKYPLKIKFMVLILWWLVGCCSFTPSINPSDIPIVVNTIFGMVELSEEVAEIYDSAPMKRLLAIKDNAALNLFDNAPTYNLHDYAVSVYYLVNRYGADIAEQIAALLCVVAQPAFASGAKVIGNADQINQASNQYFNSLDYYQFCPRHIDSNDLIDPNNNEFKLLNSEGEQLSAKKIVLVIMSAQAFKLTEPDKIKKILNHLRYDHTNRRWFFNNFEIAKYFAYLCFKLNRIYWNKPKNQVMNYFITLILKRLVVLNLLQIADLFTLNDQNIFDLINNCGDQSVKSLRQYAAVLSSCFKVIDASAGSPDFFTVPQIMILNPWVLNVNSGLMKPLTEMDKKFADDRIALLEKIGKNKNIQFKVKL